MFQVSIPSLGAEKMMDEKNQGKHGVPNGELTEDDNETLHRLSDIPDSKSNGAGNASAASNLETEIQRLRAELDKAKKEQLYLLAEFENYKKNVIKERSDMRKYGSERLLVELLSVLDIFETALKSDVTVENLESFKKGMELTASSLRSVLQRFGVEEIPAQGEPFNPSVHEAISSEATEAVPEGHISQVFKKPFKLHDRVIRPGQVVVATKPKS
jgi:molecular chaperone GrpE